MAQNWSDELALAQICECGSSSTVWWCWNGASCEADKTGYLPLCMPRILSVNTVEKCRTIEEGC